ncbi:MAG: 4'-phosphopantetheinyl transferase superfamily protein [Acholeplasmatales bacterium]|nr:4'-phosphopantetheinyl transferase superfamily protein [Acholeplasmatales bacterium]
MKQNSILVYIYNLNYLVNNPKLPDIVLEHCNKYKVDDKKNISLSNYYYLDLALKKLNSSLENISYLNGKPFINDYYISLSHSKKYFGFAISNNNIGIDIEDIITKLDLSKRILSEAELKEFNDSLDKSLYLTTKWTLKEAYGKMIGTGLTSYIFKNSISSYYTKVLDDGIISIVSDDLSNIEIIVNT